ncbi:MAG: hypothetical protein ACFE89_04935 [Candidatus Hodarchaeota archaeon]
MTISRRQRGWIIGIVLLILLFAFLSFPFLLIDTPFAVLFLNTALSVVVILFGGMLFLLALILYLGN